jgi:sugar phosphate isomerase/epimerase
MNRRDLRGAGAAAGAIRRRDLLLALAAPAALTGCSPPRPSAGSGVARQGVKNGRIKQSVALWCYRDTQWKWSLEKLCQAAKNLGCQSVELANPEEWATIRKFDLACALAPNGMPDPPFAKGLNNPRYQEQVMESTRRAIDKCADFGAPNVIAFTGYKWRDNQNPAGGAIPPEEGAVNSVKALKELARYAAPKEVTVCLEMLNTRDDSHPMKGHPGYQGDNIDYCADIVRQVGSPQVKLLFDVYHVQIMHGDVLRRIRKYAGLIAHVHVAGVPGRGEPDDFQEINYRAVMRTLLEVKYTGYVGHEFIPTRDPAQSLSEAVTLCDV